MVVWSSGQFARLPLQQSEFDSCWSLQFFPYKFVFEKKQQNKKVAYFKKNPQKLPFFIWLYHHDEL